MSEERQTNHHPAAVALWQAAAVRLLTELVGNFDSELSEQQTSGRDALFGGTKKKSAIIHRRWKGAFLVLYLTLLNDKFKIFLHRN